MGSLQRSPDPLTGFGEGDGIGEDRDGGDGKEGTVGEEKGRGRGDKARRGKERGYNPLHNSPMSAGL